MKKLNSLSKDIISAVELFAEFGQRGHYERKGQVIIQNDVTVRAFPLPVLPVKSPNGRELNSPTNGR